jgi:hypothetical protein
MGGRKHELFDCTCHVDKCVVEQWIGDWQCEKSGNTDQGIGSEKGRTYYLRGTFNYQFILEDGWMYAFNWNTTWHNKPGATTYVRRRKWIRVRRKKV